MDAGTSMREIEPQADWPWGLVTTVVEELCGGLTPHSRIHFSQALVPAGSALGVCCLWRWLSGALVWSEAGHCWFWGLLAGAPVQAKFSTGLCSTWGHLV